MARGKQNTNPNDNGENDFKVETIISRLDRIHHVLKEVEEIKDSLVCMAKQRADVEVKMRRQGEQLRRAKKKIQDLNKENEQLKGTCFRRCSVELKRTPLSVLQQKKNSEQNCAETVTQWQPENEIVSTSTMGQPNDGSCESTPVKTSSIISSDIVPVHPEFIDYQPVYKTEDQDFDGNRTCSVPSASEFPTPRVPQLTSGEGYGNLEVAGPSSDVFGSSKDVLQQQKLLVTSIKDEQFEVEYCADEEILGPDCTEELSAQGIEDQDSTDVEIFQPGEGSSSEFKSVHNLNEEFQEAGPSQTGRQIQPSAEMTIYPCNICQACFVSLNLLQSHKKHHGDRTGLKRHKCTLCSYSTDQTSNLKTHLRTHTKEKPYVCDVCRKAFTQISGLQKHKRTHTKEKPYKCKFCSKDLSDSYSLRNHVRTHTKEKPYKCDVCHKAFLHSYSLNSHILKTHSGETLCVQSVP